MSTRDHAIVKLHAMHVVTDTADRRQRINRMEHFLELRAKDFDRARELIEASVEGVMRFLKDMFNV